MNFSLYTALQSYVHNNHKKQKSLLTNQFQQVLESSGPGSSGTVLELACGGGPFASLFPPEIYLGIDVVQERIDIGKTKNPHYKFECLSVNSNMLINFLKESDFIFCHGLLHHLSDKECVDLVQNIKDYAKKPSTFIAMEPIRPKWYNPLGVMTANLDEGKYIRRSEEYRMLLGNEIHLTERYNNFPRWPVDMEAYVVKYV